MAMKISKQAQQIIDNAGVKIIPCQPRSYTYYAHARYHNGTEGPVSGTVICGSDQTAFHTFRERLRELGWEEIIGPVETIVTEIPSILKPRD